MQTDATCVEANVGHAQTVRGGWYFISLDIEIPSDALNGTRPDGGPMGHLRLAPEEAERLASRLNEMVARVRGFERA